MHDARYRTGYLYALSPIHCGGEGDLGNILEIAREVHTNYPYIPGSSLRGSIRDEVTNYTDRDAANIADRLFGKELDDSGTMGVHQIWFGDARLLWVPMRTMALQNGSRNAFAWITCPTLLRDCTRVPVEIPQAVGDTPGTYLVADAEVKVAKLPDTLAAAINAPKLNELPASLAAVKPVLAKNRIILPDDDFAILLEHALWTQIRNKLQDAGGAEVFWTDVCIPRDTIFYYHWGYTPLAYKPDPSKPPNPDDDLRIRPSDWDVLTEIATGLLQVGGQANVGRGWVQSWLDNATLPTNAQPNPNLTTAGISNAQQK